MDVGKIGMIQFGTRLLRSGTNALSDIFLTADDADDADGSRFNIDHSVSMFTSSAKSAPSVV